MKPDGDSSSLSGRDAPSDEHSVFVFDEAWSAIQHSERIEIKTVRRKLSMHELRMFLRLVLAPHLKTRSVLRRLVFTARTSGGTAGRDAALCAACDEAEGLLVGEEQVRSEQGERASSNPSPPDAVLELVKALERVIDWLDGLKDPKKPLIRFPEQEIREALSRWGRKA
jgi:hypothetical protein